MHEGKEVMQKKSMLPCMALHVPTCTMTVPSDINRTGRIVIADSWFGSVKAVIAVAYTANLDGVELQAVSFQDLKKKRGQL